MEIVVKPVCKRRDLRKFILLPAKIHRGHSNWIPPLYSDEWTYFNTRKNKSFEYCDSILLLAFRGNEVVGRILNLGSAMLESARRGGLQYIDSHLEMETNTKVRAEMEYMGGLVYKTYRVFGKPLMKATSNVESAEEQNSLLVECD